MEEQNKNTNNKNADTIDLTKIKNIFTRKKKHIAEQQTTQDKQDDFSVLSIIDFFKKYRVFFILLIPLFLAIFLRIQTDSLPMAHDWASNSINDFYRNQVTQQINQQYPNLPQANKDIIIRQEYQEFYDQNKDRLEQEIKSTSEYFKSQFKNDDGVTYLIGIDPWYYYRNARNYIDHGYEGDITYDGKYIDTKVYAGVPLERRGGSTRTINIFHNGFIAYTYKFVHFFNPGATLLGVTFFIPVILAALSVIPIFFIARKFGGNLGGFIAATYVAVHKSLLVRSVGGFADNDLYSVLFPALIIWLFLEAYESDSWTKRVIYTILAGASIGLYSFAWVGWWFIVYFIFGTLGLILIYNIMVNRDLLKSATEKKISRFLAIESIRKPLVIIAVLLISIIIFVPLFSTTRDLVNALSGPFDVIHFKDVGTTTLWPNVFTTVAEQNALSLVQVVSEAGGKLFLFLCFLGIAFSLTPNIKKDRLFIAVSAVWFLLLVIFHEKFNSNLILFIVLISIIFIMRIVYDIIKKDHETNILHTVLITTWLVSTLYASVFAVRYVLLFIVPFAIALGFALGIIVKEISEWLSKTLNMKKTFIFIVIALISLLIILKPVKESYNVVRYSGFVDMNDQWYNSLLKIKANSKENAIINSWWDFGHWFKAIAERAVTLDGGNQNRPQAHWLGKVLLTNNEKEAAAILRMLDCGGNFAFDDLNNYLKDEYTTKKIIDKIIMEDPEKAREEMKKYKIPEEVMKNVTMFAFCENKELPEDFFITSEDMVGKAGVWAHFGKWNFTKSKLINLANGNKKDEAMKFMTEDLGLAQDEANKIYMEIKPFGSGTQANSWIAPWPSFYSGFTPCNLAADSTVLLCSNGFVVNTTNQEVYTMQGGKKLHPKKASYINTDGHFVVKNYETDLLIANNGEGIGVSFIPKQNSFYSLLMHPDLVDSMFNRMFFYSGHELSCFNSFDYIKQVSGGEVFTWKVDWNCTNQIKVFSPIKQ
ncbi:hypothetical protein HZA96_06110 [Candidatus Woesearchaeota archaeon]|nr:hypothetical protein [Candidatus Woesearchaeota archaeon]